MTISIEQNTYIISKYTDLAQTCPTNVVFATFVMIYYVNCPY